MSTHNLTITIKQCPICKSYIKEQRGGISNLMMGLPSNIYWSDGKIEQVCSPLHGVWNKTFDLIKCTQCKHLFWFKDLKTIVRQGAISYTNSHKTDEYKKEEDDAIKNSVEYTEPSFEEYIQKAIEETELDNIRYCRFHAWWKGNDIRRNTKNSKSLSIIEIKNLEELINILNNDTDIYLKAEIYRELKKFDKSIELLKSFTTQTGYIFNTLLNLNIQKNNELVQFKESFNLERIKET